MKHPGNALFRNVIQSKLDEYSRIASKSKKTSTQLTWDVVRILKNEYGARFLKEESVETNGLCWVEVSNETARLKVRIAFCDARKRLAKSSSTAKGSSTTNTTSDTTSCSINGSSGTTSAAKTKRKSKTKSKKITDTDTGLSSLSLSSPSPSRSSMAAQYNLLQRQSQQLPIQVANSSTSAFLGMDGGNSKRQKLCSHNHFDWDCA